MATRQTTFPAQTHYSHWLWSYFPSLLLAVRSVWFLFLVLQHSTANASYAILFFFILSIILILQNFQDSFVLKKNFVSFALFRVRKVFSQISREDFAPFYSYPLLKSKRQRPWEKVVHHVFVFNNSRCRPLLVPKLYLCRSC